MDTYEFNEEAFVERYLKGYSSSEDIAAIDDISCVLDGEYGDDYDKVARLEDEGYFDMSINELVAEKEMLEFKVLREAFDDYLKEHHMEQYMLNR